MVSPFRSLSSLYSSASISSQSSSLSSVCDHAISFISSPVTGISASANPTAGKAPKAMTAAVTAAANFLYITFPAFRYLSIRVDIYLSVRAAFPEHLQNIPLALLYIERKSAILFTALSQDLHCVRS